METLNVYQYRFLVKHYEGIVESFCKQEITDPRKITQAKRDICDQWARLSATERDVIQNDVRPSLQLVDVDVEKYPDFPVRVWERIPVRLDFLESLSEWVDADVASFYLAQQLSILGPQETFIGNKGLFWARNATSAFLFETLRGLVKIGLLEFREEPDYQFRKNVKERETS